jgi:hypothetical protein
VFHPFNSPRSRNGYKGVKRKWEKAWQTVGRFLCEFAVLESNINEVFLRLYNLEQCSAFITLVMTGRLSFQEKLELINLAFRYVDRKKREDGVHNVSMHNAWKQLQTRVHDLQNIRNVIAHASFDPAFDEPDPQENGIDFDYVSTKGELRLAGREKKADENIIDMRITYAQFDEYEQQIKELCDALLKLLSLIDPISDFTQELTRSVAEIIAASDNVIPFPKRS